MPWVSRKWFQLVNQKISENPKILSWKFRTFVFCPSDNFKAVIKSFLRWTFDWNNLKPLKDFALVFKKKQKQKKNKTKKKKNKRKNKVSTSSLKNLQKGGKCHFQTLITFYILFWLQGSFKTISWNVIQKFANDPKTLFSI